MARYLVCFRRPTTHRAVVGYFDSLTHQPMTCIFVASATPTQAPRSNRHEVPRLQPPFFRALSAAKAEDPSNPDFTVTCVVIGTPSSTQETTIKHHGATLAIGAGQDKAVFNVGRPDTKIPGPDRTYSLTKAPWQ